MNSRSRLQDLLEAHAPADALEASYLERMRLLLEADGDPFSRSHFDPGHFTASAFVLDPGRERLLLILHGKLGLWLQPGGHFDADDSDPEAAARREVAEEAGIASLSRGLPGGSLLDVDIHTIPPNPRREEPAHAHFDLRFLFLAPSAEIRAGSDALKARWVALEQVEDAGTDDSVRRAVRKLLALM